ncbi:MAG: hypothetical protein NVS4B9_36960 [Ktedonobacteraceae bacterium]
MLAVQTPETALVSSAAVVLAWSVDAAQAAQVNQHILLAQQLKKLILPILLDATPLPSGLDASSAIATPCNAGDIQTLITNLIAHLPAPAEPFLTILQQAVDPNISERKDAIDAAAVLIDRDEHRDELLALLAYIASKDIMMGVRDKACAVLDAEQNNLAPAQRTPAQSPTRSPDMFPVVCVKGHTTYVNVRRLCAEKERIVYRELPQSGKRERQFLIPCTTKDCSEVMTAYIDCEGY